MRLLFVIAFLAAGVSLSCGGSTAPPSTTPTPPPGSVSDSPGPSAFTAGPSPSVAPATRWTGEPAGILAFVDFRDVNQEIFIKKMPDGPEIDLTNDPADDFDPDISADGTRIAFASARTGQSEIWSMNVDGSNPTQLTNDAAGGQTPRWSRDGAKIAYARGDGSIAVMNADGSGGQVIMTAEDEATADACHAGAFVGGWSPDDSRITYYSASITRAIGQVCTVAADGSDIRVIVAEPGVYDVEPVYSPDGTQILYRAIINGQHDIWVVDLATGDRRNLTQDADLDIEPDWSPDGQWIAYGSLRTGSTNFDLYIMRPDGSDLRQITSDPDKQANPVWGPLAR